MKKGLKKALKITGIVFLLFIAFIILIPIIFKGKIIKLAEEQADKNLNAKVKFEDVSVSMIRNFPNLSVELKGLSVVGIDTFKNDTLIKFKSLRAGLNLMSVISGDVIKINEIVLDNPVINAIVLHDSTANWDITKSDTTAVDTTKKSEESKFAVNLKKFQIKNAKIIYDDKSSDMYAKVENFNFSLKGDLTQDKTDLNISTTIDSLTVAMGGVKYLTKAKQGFESIISADLKNSKYTFEENKFSINEVALSFAGYVEMPDSNIVMDIVFKADKTEFKSVLSLIPALYMNDFKDIKTAGTFAFTGYAKGTYNDKNMPAYGIDLTIDKARFQYPDLPKSVENINVKVKVDAEEGTGDNMTIDVQKAHVEMASNPFDAFMFIKMTAADIAMKGNVKGKLDLNSLKDVVPLDGMTIKGLVDANLSFAGNMSDIEKEQYDKFKAEGTIGLSQFEMNMVDVPKIIIPSALMSFSPQYVDLQKFDCQLGKSDIHLVGKLDNVVAYVFKEQLLTGNFIFYSNLLDLNEFLGGDETTSTTTEETTPMTAPEIPNNIDFTLNADLKKILYDKLSITDSKGKIVLKNSKLEMEQLKMNMLEGSMTMTGSYDSKNIISPKADFSLDISGFDIHSVYTSFTTIQEMAKIAEDCSGKISAKLSLNLLLDNQLNPVFNTLNSMGAFTSNDISIKNNKLFGKIADASKVETYRNPTLKNINVAYKIINGNLTLEPTKFNLAQVETTIEGTQNLDKKIDFKLGMKIPTGAAEKLISKLPTNKIGDKVDVVVIIGGTTDDPKIIEFKSSLTDGIKEEIKEKIEEVKQDVKAKAKEIIEKAQKEADMLIAAAEKQSELIRSQAKTAGDNLVIEAKNQGQKLIDQANNPISKKAAQIAAKKLEEEAVKKSNQLNDKAKTESDNVVQEAKNKAAKIVKDAQERADKV